MPHCTIKVFWVFLVVSLLRYVVKLKAPRMKRSSADLSEDHKRKTSRSSACDTGDNGEGDVDSTGSTSVKDMLRRKIQQESNSAAEVDQLERWHKELSVAGFRCEILHLTSKHSPLLTEPSTHFPRCVLVLYPSGVHTYDQQTGPFQPVRLIIHANGDWCLQCPIYEHTVVESGKLETHEASRLMELAQSCLATWRSYFVPGGP